jgi:hypothetical protein
VVRSETGKNDGERFMSDDTRDVFISYAHADADWVRTLAENLHNSELQVFFDEWDIVPGDVLVHKLDEGILKSRNGVLIVSPASLSRPYVQEEYAAMMTRAIEGKQRLIPVLVKDAEMPPLLANRVWVDFRNADGPDYVARVNNLVRAVKGQRGPPPRLPPGSDFKAVDTRAARLSISRERTAFSADGVDVAGAPPRPDLDVGDLDWRLKRARSHWGTPRDAGDGSAGYTGLESALQETGSRLADTFLPPAVVAALVEAVAEAERLNSTMQLALDIADPLADLPWETLRLPQMGPLTLHPRVELYRHIDIGGSAPPSRYPARCAFSSQSVARRRRTPAASFSTWKPSCNASSTRPMPRAGPARPSSTSWSKAASLPFTPSWRRGAITSSTFPAMPDPMSYFWRMRTERRIGFPRSGCATKRFRRNGPHRWWFWPAAPLRKTLPAQGAALRDFPDWRGHWSSEGCRR